MKFFIEMYSTRLMTIQWTDSLQTSLTFIPVLLRMKFLFLVLKRIIYMYLWPGNVINAMLTCGSKGDQVVVKMVTETAKLRVTAFHISCDLSLKRE